MTNYRRTKIRGAWYFFTVVTYKRQRILTTKPARRILKDSIRKVQTNHPFKLSALCLLPDHLHCIWQMPDDDNDYSTRWSLIKNFFSNKYIYEGGKELPQTHSRIKKREAGIWQRRFWEHRIRCEDEFWKTVHYIHFNPVKHKLVDRIDKWPYSTYYGFLRRGIYKDFNWSIFEDENQNTSMELCNYDID